MRADISLIEGNGRLDADAFERLMQPHQAWLLRYVRYLIGGPEDAEDVAQEAMMRAYLGLDRFRGESSFRTWLRRIATRLACNHCRDSGTRRKYERRSLEFEFPPRSENLVASREVLHQVMGQLSGADREILGLVHCDSLSLRQAAEVLDIGLSAAKMRHKRARTRFIDIFETRTREDDGGHEHGRSRMRPRTAVGDRLIVGPVQGFGDPNSRRSILGLANGIRPQPMTPQPAPCVQ